MKANEKNKINKQIKSGFQYINQPEELSSIGEQRLRNEKGGISEMPGVSLPVACSPESTLSLIQTNPDSQSSEQQGGFIIRLLPLHSLRVLGDPEGAEEAKVVYLKNARRKS